MKFTGYFPSLLPGDVGVTQELILQDHGLVPSVWLPLLPLSRLIWKKGEKVMLIKERQHKSIVFYQAQGIKWMK